MVFRIVFMALIQAWPYHREVTILLLAQEQDGVLLQETSIVCWVLGLERPSLQETGTP